MSQTVREVTQKHRAFYEVVPYYIVVEERPHGTTTGKHRILAGFDVDLYGMKTQYSHETEGHYFMVHVALKKMTEKVLLHSTDSCAIEVIPSGAAVFLDARSGLQATLRIRITHGRGLDQPAGAPEERALKEVQEELRDLGITHGKPRA
ncbi:MAG: hypothetical protein ACE15E_01190 [Acidobacteriota bacterium]